MMASYVPVEQIENVWEEVSSLLEPAIKENNGEFDLTDIKTDLLEGKAILWLAYENKIIGAVVTKVVSFQRYRSLFIQLMAGSGFSDWKIYEPLLERYARDQKCKSIETLVKPSVGRLVNYQLPDYKVTHHVMVKNL